MTKKFNVLPLVNDDGCFDLQFRKDTKTGRTNSPTYYRWKAQFVVTAPKNDLEILKKIGAELKCGKVHITGSQARFSVQNIDDINNVVIPYFQKNALAGNKKKDFDLWQKGVRIIYKNKGVRLVEWKKDDLAQLVEIQKSSTKFKQFASRRTKSPKWLEMAKILSQKS